MKRKICIVKIHKAEYIKYGKSDEAAQLTPHIFEYLLCDTYKSKISCVDLQNNHIEMH